MDFPTLENDIEAIDHLNDLRDQAYRLRDTGMNQLREVSIGSKSRFESLWASDDEEPLDFIQPALIYMACCRSFAAGSETKDALKEDARQKLMTLTTCALFKSAAQPEPGVRSSRVPIFQAARVMQALICDASTIMSCPSVLCFYRIVRELYSVDSPNWFIGGARASDGSLPTAFMTGECTRAIAGLARRIEFTADLITNVVSVRNLAASIAGNPLYPAGWKKAEYRRIALSAYSRLSDINSRALVGLSRASIAKIAEPNQESFQAIDAFLRSFPSQLISRASEAVEGIAKAKREIQDYHRREKELHEAEGRWSRVELSHQTALKAVDDLDRLVQNLVAEGKELDDFLGRGLEGSHSDTGGVDSLLNSLRQAADEMRLLYAPAKDYIQSVLDREVEKGETGHINVGELAFSAASFVVLESREHDRRLSKAISLLSSALSPDGTFDNSGHLDTDSHGYSLMLVGSEVLRALAQLMEKVDFDIPAELVERMLSYFSTTAITTPNGRRVVGWTQDKPRYPACAYKWTSTLAILSLDRIGRMLDNRINRRVCRHFTHTSPYALRGDDAAPKVTLSRLFYPDYGLAQHGPADSFPDENNGESVAYFLERMRAHVLGVPSPPGYDKACFAMILFGPPGTGKTTLIEALAASCFRTLVEVTPSDFLVEGEAFVERRARIVFKALSYLTESVILFDEFDPMLRSREDESADGGRNVFSFLTPGMLPKLKDLNAKSKQHRLAFCLITNRIGTLDEAAIRSGRFDYKIGVYPPDPLSRAGCIARVISQTRKKCKDLNEPNLNKAIDALARTRNGAMTMLSEAGNFRPPVSSDRIRRGSIVSYVFDKSDRYQPGPPDADISRVRKGSGVYHDVEQKQWSWIRDWDQEIAGIIQALERGNPKSLTWDSVMALLEAPKNGKAPRAAEDHATPPICEESDASAPNTGSLPDPRRKSRKRS